MLTDSGLFTRLKNISFDQCNQPLCVYGDPAYLLRVNLQRPFKNAAAGLTPEHNNYKKAVSQVLTSVELVFGDILISFFLDFKKKLKNWA